tara:strand:+ start:712 stop:972 length:261 start_codon:yes stop_codon:yes gene_type:complete
MKNTGLYYLIIVVPLLIILALMFSSKEEQNSITGIVSFFLYIFVYRPVIDWERLKSKNVKIDKWYKLFIPFYRLKFYKELYLCSPT